MEKLSVAVIVVVAFWKLKPPRAAIIWNSLFKVILFGTLGFPLISGGIEVN